MDRSGRGGGVAGLILAFLVFSPVTSPPHDALATPSEFRTEPLMGLGLSKRFLHDGRAASLEEAVRAHAGEAQPARDRFLSLTPSQRAALLEFLHSL